MSVCTYEGVVFPQRTGPLYRGASRAGAFKDHPYKLKTMFRKILIANRGEIALRIIRACREMGIARVIAHSEADRGSRPVRMGVERICIVPGAGTYGY